MLQIWLEYERKCEPCDEVDEAECEAEAEAFLERVGDELAALNVELRTILADLDGEHRDAVRAYLDAREKSSATYGAYDIHDEERALESAGIVFGLVAARKLRALLEPRRLRAEAAWAESKRVRVPALYRAEIAAAAADIARDHSDAADAYLTQWRLWQRHESLQAAVERRSIPEELLPAVAEAVAALDDYDRDEGARFAVHARLRAALARFDAAQAARLARR